MSFKKNPRQSFWWMFILVCELFQSLAFFLFWNICCGEENFLTAQNENTSQIRSFKTFMQNVFPAKLANFQYFQAKKANLRQFSVLFKIMVKDHFGEWKFSAPSARKHHFGRCSFWCKKTVPKLWAMTLSDRQLYSMLLQLHGKRLWYYW